MWAVFSKWGAIVVLIIIIATLITTFTKSIHGISTWIGDHYLPKKYMILEKYPVRIIVYGQIDDIVDTTEDSNSSKKIYGTKTSNLIRIIKAMDSIHYEDGKFNPYTIDVNFNSNFNSKQIRSSQRSIPINNASFSIQKKDSE